jgi:hypothetical protein
MTRVSKNASRFSAMLMGGQIIVHDCKDTHLLATIQTFAQKNVFSSLKAAKCSQT